MAILTEKIKIISWLDLKASTLKLSNRDAAFGTITNNQTKKQNSINIEEQKRFFNDYCVRLCNIRQNFISSDSPKVFAIGSSISCELLLGVLSQWTETPFTWPHFPVSGGLSYYFINRNVISWLQWPQTKEQNNCTQPRPTSPFWEKQELFLCSAIIHEFSPWIFHVIVSI